MAVPQKKRTGMRRKKRVCSFCAENGETLSYKDVAKLRRYVSERGRFYRAVSMAIAQSISAC